MKCHQAQEKLRCTPLAEFLKGGTHRRRTIAILNNDQEVIPQITGQIVETGVQNAREPCLTKQNKVAGVLGCQLGNLLQNPAFAAGEQRDRAA